MAGRVFGCDAFRWPLWRYREKRDGKVTGNGHEASRILEELKNGHFCDHLLGCVMCEGLIFLPSPGCLDRPVYLPQRLDSSREDIARRLLAPLCCWRGAGVHRQQLEAVSSARLFFPSHQTISHHITGRGRTEQITIKGELENYNRRYLTVKLTQAERTNRTANVTATSTPATFFTTHSRLSRSFSLSHSTSTDRIAIASSRKIGEKKSGERKTKNKNVVAGERVARNLFAP
ncbi:hypothetical protein DAPPUDRAFT_103941 [Daphnia pulex]|uniref:Uncharacterized protein n=1 Tax=Daphnia pulex TaxID=6669 RepID=E9GKT9_DAPPU|nr:hypothetical protein DAPPUDRAFT_103941 [Daphnia pulex]|eukprot:EFX79909.1 hypothetical protein DAPPUDRAFT_103941 [Daphnia pulex]